MPRWPKRKDRPGVDRYGRTPLWYHAMNGDLAGIRTELASGADPSFGDDVNYSPLQVAVQEGRVDAIRLLLVAGADPNKTDNHGSGPLWTAVCSAPNVVRVEIITLLLAAGADPDHKNRYSLSPRVAANTRGGGLEMPFAAVSSKEAEPSAAADSRSWRAYMKSRAEIERAWSAHLQRPFPRELVGRELEGVCLTSCDTYLAGCVSHFVNGGALGPARADVIARVSADIRRVLPHLSGEAHEYFSELLAVGAALQS